MIKRKFAKNRHLSKAVYREEFKGYTETLAAAAYIDIRED
ncbi:RPE1 domain protein [Rickettsia amblyommatis str. Darkwater]|uniref:GTP-binding protein Era n=2 Tax=Rickettsia amblyommatis TaxID=33989 RepID=H8K3M0_RICAG|nr:palindromic element RPE1 domain-containing protein [Rickettsia amblyommatis]AFC69114.1 GTP-binding protein Era [Rickettsia amblyommatis str. GAT-30V]KJV61296.1 RPE1 domain protein [Rickettsia amblyommatis str. Ac/Pa]KJV97950.1 RPE1 domain protein [Rickettsia amblyommatis str. Darkwater]